jgi:hypothetical protein
MSMKVHLLEMQCSKQKHKWKLDFTTTFSSFFTSSFLFFEFNFGQRNEENENDFFFSSNERKEEM